MAELDKQHEGDLLFAFLDDQQKEVHVTKEFAVQYQGPANPCMWNTSLHPVRTRVLINLANVEEREKNEERQVFGLIVDKAIQIDTKYRLGSFECIEHFDLEKAPIIVAIYIQALRNLLRATSDADNEQINRTTISFLLHALAATGQLTPRHQVLQVDHPCISIQRTDQDQEMYESFKADWLKYIESERGVNLAPSAHLMNMLMLMPGFTAADTSFRLTSVNDIMLMATTLEQSLDVRGDPQSARLWHLEFTHSGADTLNPQTFTIQEVNATKQLGNFIKDLVENARGPEGFDCPLRQFMDPAAVQPGTTLILGFDCEMAQTHPRWATEMAWIAWQKGDPMCKWVNMNKGFKDWWAMVPWDKEKTTYVTHLIFCNHTGSRVMLNIHKICLSRCIEGLDPWISDVAMTKEELMKLPQRLSGPEWDELMKILTSTRTILVRWGMANDRIAFKNSFGITLI